MATLTAAPKTAAEAQTMLQDATDNRDALDRRFQAGDPPPANEWSAALERMEYAKLALVGLEAKEKAESVVSARKRALALRKKYRVAIEKQLVTVIAAEDEFAKAARVLIEAVAAHNGQAASLSEEGRALLPAHIPSDAVPEFLKGALKFGGSVPPQINSAQLLQGAVHATLQGAFKSLTGRDVEFLRSLEGPGLSESKRVRDLRQTLEIKE